jgi:Ca2+-binding EF-hand superfamily protein
MRGPLGPDFEIDFEAVEDSVFKALDTDQNGMLSRTEFSREKVKTARGNAIRKAIFAELDANHDGALSADELPSPVEHLRALDADGDGKVTREERRAHWRNRGAAGHPGAPAGTGA